jgi:predicted ATPase
MLGSTRDGVTPLVGRLEEQSLLTSLLDDVATRGQALVLHGEPGIGKSRLLSEAE